MIQLDGRLASSGGEVLETAALRTAVGTGAARLRELGVSRDDVVVLVAGNGPLAATSLLALMAVAAAAPANPALPAPEALRFLAAAGATAVLVEAGDHQDWRLAAEAAGLPLLELRPSGRAGEFDVAGDRVATDVPEPGAGAHDVLRLTTSGTTARPKLVGLTEANLAATASAVAGSVALTPGDVVFNVMPLFHIHGIVAALLAGLCAGATVVCAPGATPSLPDAFSAAGGTYMTCVPTVHLALLRMAGGPSPAWARSLRILRSSSAPLGAALRGRLESTFQVPVVEAYGMTEAAHQIASTPWRDGAWAKPGSVGLPGPAEVRVLRADCSPAAPGEDGDVVIRGAGVITGYRAPAEANQGAFVDGWLLTGDIGHLDAEGALFLTGRAKEMINRGGEKVSPYEVEEVLMSYPGVAQAVAFPVSHPTLGEEVGAAVVAGPEVDPADLAAFARRMLGPAKAPRTVLAVDSLPLGPTGKLQRLTLAAALGLT